MQTRRWVNQSQPQTLVIATFLLYFTAVLGLLGQYPPLGDALTAHKTSFGVFADSSGDLLNQVTQLFVVIGAVAGGYLISNERKPGWFLAVAVAAVPLLTTALWFARFQSIDNNLIGLLFDVALFALLLHEQSRNYIRIWFK